MTLGRRSSAACVQQEISALLPWYVNGTIGEHDRQRVDAHLTLCASCGEDMERERLICQGMTVETAVEYMPAASLKRLQARLDGVAAAPANAGPQADAPTQASAAAAQKPRRSAAWQAAMAASIAVAAVALSLLAADRWLQFRARTSAPSYYTVTTSAARAPGEVIRAVFSPTITLAELQAILDETELRIVSGPTEAGVYSLAANSGRPVNSSLALLRSNSNVRFAERTQPSPGAGDTP
jgi:hypothetical protein